MRSDGISLTNSPRDPISRVSSSPGRPRRLIYDDWKRHYDLRYWKQLCRKGPLICSLVCSNAHCLLNRSLNHVPLRLVCSLPCSACSTHPAHLFAHSFTCGYAWFHSAPCLLHLPQCSSPHLPPCLLCMLLCSACPLIPLALLAHFACSPHLWDCQIL